MKAVTPSWHVRCSAEGSSEVAMITISHLFVTWFHLPLRRRCAVVVTTWTVGQPPQATL